MFFPSIHVRCLEDTITVFVFDCNDDLIREMKIYNVY